MLLTLYTCKEALARLEDYLDKELSSLETERVEKHLRLCHECTRKFAFEGRLLEEMRTKLQRLVLPPSMREKLSPILHAESAINGHPSEEESPRSLGDIG